MGIDSNLFSLNLDLLYADWAPGKELSINGEVKLL